MSWPREESARRGDRKAASATREHACRVCVCREVCVCAKRHIARGGWRGGAEEVSCVCKNACRIVVVCVRARVGRKRAVRGGRQLTGLFPQKWCAMPPKTEAFAGADAGRVEGAPHIFMLEEIRQHGACAVMSHGRPCLDATLPVGTDAGTRERKCRAGCVGSLAHRSRRGESHGGSRSAGRGSRRGAGDRFA